MRVIGEVAAIAAKVSTAPGTILLNSLSKASFSSALHVSNTAPKSDNSLAKTSACKAPNILFLSIAPPQTTKVKMHNAIFQAPAIPGPGRLNPNDAAAHRSQPKDWKSAPAILEPNLAAASRGSTSVPPQSASEASPAAPEGAGPATLIEAASSPHKDDSLQTPDIEQFAAPINERSPGQPTAAAAPAVTKTPMPSVHRKRRGRGYRSFLGPATATPAMHETDRKWLAQRDMDYGPAFAPYTTKLLKRAEGWEGRPALWDISPGVDHPIVVLSVDVSGPEDAIVTFIGIQSFKSVGAKTSLLNFWKKYLPLSRSRARAGETIPRCERAGRTLCCSARTTRLGKQTGCRERRIIGIPHRLCEKSMAQLRAARTWWEGHWNTGRGLVRWEDEWVPSGKMRDVFRQRYIEALGEEDNELGSVVAGKKSSGEALQMVNRAEKAVVELELAKSARPPIPPPEGDAVRAEDGKNRGGRREGRDGRDARRNGQDEGGTWHCSKRADAAREMSDGVNEIRESYLYQ
ncbi:hypothetical protein GMDG_06667 [Pseudogymnoascus destructans 20631-21]|uniref:Uncharacterized protein n=1 Tax=Pseudogymnoascus destructans (strain ATCC MYA-4855 / 20631-21) TaxID=658429 RepID=L8FTQ7_PSED2|nr:hypothetical protein GMDG_06667 [Pseudogymnoascus destructans 20631-21]